MTTDTVRAIEDHPAKFTKTVLAEMGVWLQREADLERRSLFVLDPFAGVGRVHQLATTWGICSLGVEIEPEWAACHEDTICGDALALTDLFPMEQDRFDVIATSPCYGNRLADHHDAQDLARCPDCAPDPPSPACETCHGRGRTTSLSRRNTYTHRLRAATEDPTRTLAPTSSATIPWGPRYRQFHERAYRQMLAVLRPGGLVMVNISNFLETSKGVTVEHRVAEWTLGVWLNLGSTIIAIPRIETPRNRQGANYDVRVDGELLLVLRAPTGPAQLL